MFSDGHFAVISPASTLFAYLPWLALWKANIVANGGYIVFIKFAALFAFLGPSLYVPRFFCRYFCPLGTLMDPTSSYKVPNAVRPAFLANVLQVLRISRNEKGSKDEQNKILSDVCPMGVQVDGSSNFIDHVGCVHCGRCVAASPSLFTQEIAPLVQ